MHVSFIKKSASIRRRNWRNVWLTERFLVLKTADQVQWYYVNKKYKLNLEIFRRKTLSNKNIHYTFS